MYAASLVRVHGRTATLPAVREPLCRHAAVLSPAKPPPALTGYAGTHQRTREAHFGRREDRFYSTNASGLPGNGHLPAGPRPGTITQPPRVPALWMIPHQGPLLDPDNS